MTSVGYGDRYPTTGTGRLAAAGLMVAGIALLGSVTATLASWLVEQLNVAQEAEVLDLKAEVSELHRKLDAILDAQESSRGAQALGSLNRSEPALGWWALVSYSVLCPGLRVLAQSNRSNHASLTRGAKRTPTFCSTIRSVSF